MSDHRVIRSECVAAMREMAAESIDAICTDPPYELGFMGKRWDASGIAYSLDLWREALRVLKPGGHLVAFGGTRTYHRMACAIEDAGFEIRDSLHWLYGSGFPKSLNIGEGRGTALKPAHEPIVLARKPLAGTVAANVLRYGTGALNVDGCRVEGAVQNRGGWCNAGYVRPRTEATFSGGVPESSGLAEVAGRWPPNLLLTHDPRCNGTCAPGCPVAILDEQSGELTSGEWTGQPTGGKGSDVSAKGGGFWGGKADRPYFRAPDAGGASRFFPVFQYVPKPARAERDAGLDDLPERSGGAATDREDGSEGLRSPRAGAGRNGGARNIHPTVKPVALMEWLVRLVTPPGGTVLDPFLGSGTTGCAAVRLGFDFIGIEREAEYVEIAERRIRLALNAPRSKPLGALERADEEAPGQLAMFGAAQGEERGS